MPPRLLQFQVLAHFQCRRVVQKKKTAFINKNIAIEIGFQQRIAEM